MLLLPDCVLDDTLAFFVVSGGDPLRFLNGLCTQDLRALEDGEGTTAFVLESKGKTIALVRLARVGAAMHAWTERSCAPTLLQHLSKHAAISGVRVSMELSPAVRAVTAAGAESQGLHAAQLCVASAALNNCAFDGPNGVVYRDRAWGVPSLLVKQRTPLDAHVATLPRVETLDPWRVDAGVPRYGIDIHAGVLPAESSLEAEAVSYTKGCYCGQEVVARQHFLGKPRVRLCKLVAAQPFAPNATPVHTSIAPAIDGNGWCALALLPSARASAQ